MQHISSLVLLFVYLCSSNWASAQQQMSNQDYVDRFKDISMQKMREYRIPASITLAQGILESGSGNSILAKQGNNHFGIKCHGWQGRKIYHDDDEANECFRAYKKPEESFHDHSLFLTTRPRYAFLFDLDIMDYKAWAHGLSKAGYATNPRYPELLIRIIERNELYIYDRMAMDKKYLATKPSDELIVHEPYIPPSVASFKRIDHHLTERQVYENNRRRLIIAEKDDTFHSLAVEFGIFGWQIVKYNELNRSDELVEGQIVYLQKKRRRSQTQEAHIVQVGETIYGISQQYGIRLHALLRMNNMPDGIQLAAGTRLKLR